MQLNLILKTIIFCLFYRLPGGTKISRLHFTSSHTSFSGFCQGERLFYDSVFYNASEHYMTVLFYWLSRNIWRRPIKIDLISRFHGWGNNTDTAAEFYKLTKQFIASNRNAILVLAETAKNSS